MGLWSKCWAPNKPQSCPHTCPHRLHEILYDAEGNSIEPIFFIPLMFLAGCCFLLHFFLYTVKFTRYYPLFLALRISPQMACFWSFADIYYWTFQYSLILLWFATGFSEHIDLLPFLLWPMRKPNDYFFSDWLFVCFIHTLPLRGNFVFSLDYNSDTF